MKRLSILARAAVKLSLILAGAAFATNAQAQCSRETLQKIADTYVTAQKDGKAALLPLAKGASYAENTRVMDIRQGVLAGALKVDFTRSFHDTTQCATFTELVAATDPHPYVIHTRIEATKGGKVSKMESVVTDAGDWVFGATEHLAVTRSQDWGEIPKDKRDSRAVLQAAADLSRQLGRPAPPGAARHALRPARRPHRYRRQEPGGQYLRHGGVSAEAQSRPPPLCHR